jgi:hypothetical protein
MKKIASFLIILLIGVAIDADAKKKARKFYLTPDPFTGSQALTACAKKFHMASLWEIFDFSNLRYETTLGATRPDSGFGPPAGLIGWIRTGGLSAGTDTILGQNNCFAWTSDSNLNVGILVGINDFWENAGLAVDPWLPFQATCNSSRRVWCVQD